VCIEGLGYKFMSFKWISRYVLAIYKKKFQHARSSLTSVSFLS